jgi:hypothetical protein
MQERELPLDYAIPAPASRAKRPFWLNVTYLVLGAMAIGIAILCLLEQIRVGHLQLYAEMFGCPALLLLGLIFMTKGLAIFENNQQET